MTVYVFFFFKQKTAYEMRISDWSSDVCSSDLRHPGLGEQPGHLLRGAGTGGVRPLRERGGLARARAGAAGGAAGVGDSLARVATGAVALLILWSGFSRELCCCPSPCEGSGRLGGGVHGLGCSQKTVLPNPPLPSQGRGHDNQKSTSFDFRS